MHPFTVHKPHIQIQPATPNEENKIQLEPKPANMSMKYKLSIYDGLNNGEDFWSKFELLKSACKWQDDEAALHLHLHLTGPADTIPDGGN